MNIIELNEGNITDYKNIIDPDAAENISREFYRGLATGAKGGEPSEA